jgi:hypothetical protein
LPATVIGYVPLGVLEPTEIVISELPEPGAGIVVGLKATVVPEGMPEADRLIELLNPLLTVVVIVVVPWKPCATVKDDGAAPIVKFPEAVTVSEVVPLIDPEAALIVVLPAATPVAKPVLLIVAIEGELEVHVAEFVKS